MVGLVGIEPAASSLRTMRSPKKPRFGVHLAVDYGPKRSNSNRLAGSCLTTYSETTKGLLIMDSKESIMRRLLRGGGGEPLNCGLYQVAWLLRQGAHISPAEVRRVNQPRRCVT